MTRIAALSTAMLLLALELGAQAPKATDPDTAAPGGARAIPPQESLLYAAKFGLLRVGEARTMTLGIDTIRGIPSLHIRFVLKGGTFFYPLHDQMDSWVGLDDFASRRFVQDFDEGGKKRQSSYEIFPDSGGYRQSGSDSLLPASRDPLDDAAFFYFVRTVPLEPGKRYEFPRYFRPDRNPVVLEVIGRDTIDVPAGRFPTLLVRPIIKGRGIFAEKAEARMWISDDPRRLMVQLKSKFVFGTITLALAKTEADAKPEPERSGR